MPTKQEVEGSSPSGYANTKQKGVKMLPYGAVEMPEIIVCAAQRAYKHGDECPIIIPSVRHFDKNTHSLLDNFIIDLGIIDNWEQGFLTSKYRFVDREEAAKIAVENNQVKRLVGNQKDLNSVTVLFSENLY